MWEISVSVGFIRKIFVAMHGHVDVKFVMYEVRPDNIYNSSQMLLRRFITPSSK